MIQQINKLIKDNGQYVKCEIKGRPPSVNGIWRKGYNHIYQPKKIIFWKESFFYQSLANTEQHTKNKRLVKNDIWIKGDRFWLAIVIFETRRIGDLTNMIKITEDSLFTYLNNGCGADLNDNQVEVNLNYRIKADFDGCDVYIGMLE